MTGQGTLKGDDETPEIPGAGPAVEQEPTPEFLSGPRDGELVPVDQLHKSTIYVEKKYPWLIVEFSRDDTYPYNKAENGDYVCILHSGG